MNKNIKTKEKKNIKYLATKKGIVFKSKLKQMETAYNNNEAKKFYQEVKSTRTGCQQQKFLIRDKDGNRVNNNEKVLQRWSEYYEKHFELRDGTEMTVEKSGRCVYKLQNHKLNHKKCRQRWQKVN